MGMRMKLGVRIGTTTQSSSDETDKSVDESRVIAEPTKAPRWDRESLGRRAEPRFIPPCLGDETANGSYRECPLHLGGLQLALGTSPVPIDVRGHFQRGVAEMAGQPSDVCTALEAAFRERMPEAVEGPLFLGRSDPWNRRLLHGGVQMAPKKSERRQVALVPTVEYEAGRIVPLPVPPTTEKVDDIADESTSRRSRFFGDPIAPPVNVRRTRTTACSRSTSPHLSPSSSPWRMPVFRATRQSVRYGSSTRC